MATDERERGYTIEKRKIEGIERVNSRMIRLALLGTRLGKKAKGRVTRKGKEGEEDLLDRFILPITTHIQYYKPEIAIL